MLCPALHKLMTWLCLVAALFMGVAPAQGLVFCFEPSGRLTLEAAVDGGHCAGCPDFAPSHQPLTAGGIVANHARCPCVDIHVAGGSDEARTQPQRAELHLAVLVALPISAWTPLPVPPTQQRGQVVPPPPRAPPDLQLIRTIVLLV